MPEHRWGGWPGAWCLDCGCEDPREVALAEGNFVQLDNGDLVVKGVTPEQMECKEPGSRRHDPADVREKIATLRSSWEPPQND